MHARHHGIRRFASGIGKVTLALLFFIILFVLALLLTQAGTARLVQFALHSYNPKIPGNIAAKVTGTIFSTLALQEVELSDASGELLARAQRLEIELNPWAMLRGAFEIRSTTIDDLDVVANGRWGDLALPASSNTSPTTSAMPAGMVGPQLPLLTLRALTLHDARVSLREGDKQTRIATIAQLKLGGTAFARNADIWLDADANLPTLGLDIQSLHLSSGWRDPGAWIETLDIRGNFGELRLQDAEFSAFSDEWRFDSLSAKVDPTWLATFIPSALDSTLVSLQATAPSGKPVARIELTSKDFVHLVTNVEVRSTDPDALDTTIQASATTLATDAVALDTRIDYFGDLYAKKFEASAQLRAGEASELAADLTRGEDGLYQLSGGWHSTQLGELNSILARFGVGLPPLAGSSGQVACTANAVRDLQSCDAAIELRNAIAQSRISLQTSVHFGETIRADITKLALVLRETKLHQTGKTIRVELDGEQITLQDLTLSTTNRASKIEASGKWIDLNHADVRVEVTRFDLRNLNAFLPTLRLRGQVDATLAVTRSEEAFDVDATLTGRHLFYQGWSIARLRSRATVHDGGASLSLVLQGGIAGKYTDLHVRTQLEGLPGPEFAFSNQQPLSAKLRIRELDLTKFRTRLNLPTLAGTLHGELLLAGSLHAPRFDANIQGKNLGWQGYVVQEIDLQTHATSHELTIAADLRGPLVKSLRIDATLPIAFRLDNAAFRWRKNAPHQAVLDAQGLDLAALPLSNMPDISGEVDLRATLAGKLRNPTLDVTFDAHELASKTKNLGNLSGELSLADARTKIDLRAQGPLLGESTVSASLPVAVDLLHLRSNWRPDAAHSLNAVVRHADLQRLQYLWPSSKASGILELQVDGSGTALSPELTVHAQLTNPGWTENRADQATLDASFADERLVLRAVAKNGGGAFEVGASLPVQYALVDYVPKLALDTQQDHTFYLKTKDLDRAALAGIWQPPEGVEASITGSFQSQASGGHVLANSSFVATLKTPGIPTYVLTTLFDGDERKQHLSSRLSDVRGEQAHLQLDTKIDLPALAAGKVELSQAALRSVLEIRGFQVEALRSLAPTPLRDVSGVVSAHLQGNGTVLQPAIRGTLGLEDASLTVVAMRQRLSDILVHVAVEPGNIHISRASLISGAGSLRVEGDVMGTREEIRANLAWKLDRFPIQQGSLPTMRVTAAVATNVKLAAESLDIDIGIKDPYLRILTLTPTGADPIATNANVHYVDAQGLRAQRILAANEAAAAAPKKKEPRAIALNMHFDEPLVVRGPAIATTWTGRVKGLIAPSTRVEGSFQTEKGSTFNLLGNTFEIERGLVTLGENAGIEPFISITALTKVESVTITAAIRGRVTEPEIRFTSDTTDDEQQIFAMLATGRANVDNVDTAGVVARAASALAAFSNSRLQDTAERLGLDTLRVGFGKSLEDSAISGGKNLGKNVYVESTFRQQATQTENMAQALVRIRLSTQWALELFFGDRAVGGAGLWWSLVFDSALPGAKTEAAQSNPSDSSSP